MRVANGCHTLCNKIFQNILWLHVQFYYVIKLYNIFVTNYTHLLCVTIYKSTNPLCITTNTVTQIYSHGHQWSDHCIAGMYSTVQYSTVLYCTVIVQYIILQYKREPTFTGPLQYILYCTVMYCTVLYCTRLIVKPSCFKGGSFITSLFWGRLRNNFPREVKK